MCVEGGWWRGAVLPLHPLGEGGKDQPPRKIGCGMQKFRKALHSTHRALQQLVYVVRASSVAVGMGSEEKHKLTVYTKSARAPFQMSRERLFDTVKVALWNRLPASVRWHFEWHHQRLNGTMMYPSEHLYAYCLAGRDQSQRSDSVSTKHPKGV